MVNFGICRVTSISMFLDQADCPESGQQQDDKGYGKNVEITIDNFFDPLSIPFIRHANEAGFGTGDISGVEIIGDDISEVNFNFRVNPTFQDSVLWWLQTSSIAKFTYFLPMLFNDWYWYIAVGEKRIKETMKSGWGKLFETYRK